MSFDCASGMRLRGEEGDYACAVTPIRPMPPRGENREGRGGQTSLGPFAAGVGAVSRLITGARGCSGMRPTSSNLIR
ncbi:hypothetical protein EVAR_60840_1 [Eumeta japonica]|uniref:Uncharacterized protein n=1 Tax=Eumeta variegata TaxID=151549 RepID=A0A4C1Y9Y6_EUMVA|nr:hypothetical protein EVAR_60840_1 [Eumeta japonica]